MLLENQDNFEIKRVTPDNRNRIALGEFAEGVSHFDVIFNKSDFSITLKPYVSIPKEELWIWENPEVLSGIEEAIEQALAGDVGPLPPQIQKDIDAEYKNLKNEGPDVL